MSKVKISSRTLVKLITGQISWNEFLADYGALGTVIQNRVAEGCLFESISVEKCLDYDDDWITLTFSGPDPAISEFKVSRK